MGSLGSTDTSICGAFYGSPLSGRGLQFANVWKLFPGETTSVVWHKEIGGPSSNKHYAYGRFMDIDNAGNVYIALANYNPLYLNGPLVKLTNNGDIQWSQTLGERPFSAYYGIGLYGIRVGPSEGIYVAINSSSGYSAAKKINPADGSVLTDYLGDNGSASAVDVDLDGRVYTTSYAYSTIVRRWENDGTLIDYITDYPAFCWGICVDDNGRSYSAGGRYGTPSTAYSALFGCWDGVKKWVLVDTSGGAFRAIACDNNGHIYTASPRQPSYDASTVICWQLNDTSVPTFVWGAQIGHTLDNVQVMGTELLVGGRLSSGRYGTHLLDITTGVSLWSWEAALLKEPIFSSYWPSFACRYDGTHVYVGADSALAWG